MEFPGLGTSSEPSLDPVDTSTIVLVERDVEAPEVFQMTDSGLWDGRPSLGGVWVAYPGDVQPERVLIRNEETKKFVIGALFKRERVNPGPKFQLSSDAAAALGIIAGKPTMLNVTALRRDKVPEAGQEPAFGGPVATTGTALGDIASAAIDEVEGTTTPSTTAGANPPEPRPGSAAATTTKAASTLTKPFIQIGIFSIEKNAQNTATALRTRGVTPTIKQHSTKGKKFWRVVIGPAANSSEQTKLLKIARDLGFTDAYFVTN